MNIVILMGSPRRNGSTCALTEEILKGASEKVRMNHGMYPYLKNYSFP